MYFNIFSFPAPGITENLELVQADDLQNPYLNYFAILLDIRFQVFVC